MNDAARTLLNAAIGDIAVLDVELARVSTRTRDVRRSWRLHSYFATRALARHRLASAATMWIRSCTEAAVVGGGQVQIERTLPLHELILGPLEAALDGWVDVMMSERQELMRLVPQEVERQMLFHVTQQDWRVREELVRDCTATAPEHLGEDDRLLLEHAVYERAELRLISAELEHALGIGRRLARRLRAPGLTVFDELVRAAIPTNPLLDELAAYIVVHWFGAEPLMDVITEVVPVTEVQLAAARATELSADLQLTEPLLGADDVPWSTNASEWA